MAIYSREQAARNAEKSRHNEPAMCQKWTHDLYNAPSVGDVDKDGDADALDGWKSEPARKRHGDRNPPRGVPVAWAGGSKGHGHRAISLGNGKIRSTDAGGSGVVATVDLRFPERSWGMTYLGWSETIDGFAIPNPPPSATRVSKARVYLEQAYKVAVSKGQTKRARLIKSMLDVKLKR